MNGTDDAENAATRRFIADLLKATPNHQDPTYFRLLPIGDENAPWRLLELLDARPQHGCAPYDDPASHDFIPSASTDHEEPLTIEGARRVLEFYRRIEDGTLSKLDQPMEFPEQTN